MPQDNRELIRRFYEECWSKGNLAIVDELVSTECKFHHSVFQTLGPGTDDMRRYITVCRTGFPDLSFHIDNLIVDDDEAVIHWTASGTHEGRFMGIPPSHKPAKLAGVSILRFRDGKIVEQWIEWNLVALLSQLGVTDSPKTQVRAL
jgi:steroid delta-isomerase-like uncharacterized protein